MYDWLFNIMASNMWQQHKRTQRREKKLMEFLSFSLLLKTWPKKKIKKIMKITGLHYRKFLFLLPKKKEGKTQKIKNEMLNEWWKEGSNEWMNGWTLQHGNWKK